MDAVQVRQQTDDNEWKDLDPEDMREMLRAYQDACSSVISRYDGYVAKFMGDGVYAYFGYPTAHEDDAERAISAGLGIHPACRVAICRAISDDPDIQEAATELVATFLAAE